MSRVAKLEGGQCRAEPGVGGSRRPPSSGSKNKLPPELWRCLSCSLKGVGYPGSCTPQWARSQA